MPALHVWGCCSGPRDRHPEFTPPAPQRRAFHPHVLCVTVACDTGTALPPARPPPRRAPAGFPRAALPAWDGYVGAKLEQGCSQAVQSHPKQIWSALKVPSCHPWQMLHRHPELCDRRPHAPLEARTLGSYTAPGKAHLGSWGTERRYPSNCLLITQSRENRGKSQGCRISCRSKMGKPRGVGFAVGEGTWEALR